MNLAILTNGGDTCALNASVEAIRSEARKIGFGKIIGICGGYHGLIHRKFQTLACAIDKRMGGSFLGSLRESPCVQQDGRYRLDMEKVSKMADCLRELEVDVLVVIGGDGTLQATKLFHQHAQDRYKFHIMGFPKTIDNDIRTKSSFGGMEVSLCPGYPTAARRIAQVTEDIRTTAISAHRVFAIETMGRDAGWLAAAAAEGGPDMILIPEVVLDRDIKERLLDRTERLFRQSENVVFVVSEGARWTNEEGQVEQIRSFEFGPRKLGGVADKIVKYVEGVLKGRFDDSTPFEVRPHHSDYVPRAGSPCEYDLRLVAVLAERLRILLEEKTYGKVPVLANVVPYESLEVRHTAARSFDEMEPKLFPKRDFYDEERLLTNEGFGKFVRTITVGPDSR